jgi:2-dehydro-3-deoxygluconokinase
MAEPAGMKVVTFGEIMLRLSPPGFERFLQTPQFVATFGGGEANVAVSLAQFGLDSYYVTRLPKHEIGEAAVRALRAEGVRTDYILRGGDRIGVYYAETGASQRASTVIYDRARSAISEMEPDAVDWKAVFDGARWFHVTGITPALGDRGATSTARAIGAARAAGVRISVDLNFRKKLWTEKRAQEVMGPLMRDVDVVIANEEDLQSVLGVHVPGTDVTSGQLNLDGFREAAERVTRDFGPPMVAITLRESVSASDNGWSAVLWNAPEKAMHRSQRYDVRLVDRIGGGDSFAGGLIYGLVTGRSPQDALRFAVAASALKQTIPADFNRVTVAEVDRLAAGDASGRVQR